jgi:hypothetical protein
MPWLVITNKRKPPESPPSAALPIVDLASTPAAKKARIPVLPAVEEPGVFLLPPCVLPSLAPPTVAFQSAFKEYLLNPIATQSEAIKELGDKNETLALENLPLIEENNWLYTAKANLVKMCNDLQKKKAESQQQVSHLKNQLTSQVVELSKEFALVKVTLEKQSECNTTNSHLAKLQVEKNLVVQLKANLDAAPVVGIPIPESIHDLASAIESIVNCTTKKGTHLKTKIKLICGSVLTTVFNCKCLSYLVDQTFCQVQGENPYQHAIEIAKIIDLSGSLIHLSGYDTLWKGIKGDATGKVERNGSWLSSNYHIMKCMKALEIAVQKAIPLKHPLELPEM